MNRLFTRSLTKVSDQVFRHGNKLTFGPTERSLTIGYIDGELNHHRFHENPRFMPQLHSLIANKVYDDLPFIMEASVAANAFMPIYDFRNVPKYGRIPNIENVYGYLQVDADGTMIRDTYQANPMYQVWTEEGLITLSDFLLEEIRKVED